jgi:hypothetical protein
MSIAATVMVSCDKTGLPDPLILTFYFSLRDRLIGQLISIHNELLV